MPATVIYDGQCNFCTFFVQMLEKLDQGKQFSFVPMQAEETLQQLGIAPEELSKGVVLLHEGKQWQGADAIETIGKFLPGFREAISLYQVMPGVKPLGDVTYAFVRDHRYTLFGKRTETYESLYPFCTDRCEQEHSSL